MLVLVLALGVLLLDLTVPDRIVENGGSLLDSAFPDFQDSGCFIAAAPEVVARQFCVSAPCCEAWNALVSEYVDSLTLSVTDPKIRHRISSLYY